MSAGSLGRSGALGGLATFTITREGGGAVSHFQGWLAYDEFVNAIRADRAPSQDFLDVLAETSKHRIQHVGAGTRLWRAQKGCSWNERSSGEGGVTYIVRSPVPYSAERMVPDAAHVKEGGRGNPPSTAYLYLADSTETAIAEVRPWVSAHVSVASFIAERDLRLVDLTRFPPPDPFGIVTTSTPHPDVTDEIVWGRINGAFATPVDPNDPQSDYSPTQHLARFFREREFDGLLYGSALHEDGKNYMLYQLTDARIEQRDVVQVTHVTYTHRALGRSRS